MKKTISMFLSGLLILILSGLVSSTSANGDVKSAPSNACPPKHKHHRFHRKHVPPSTPCIPCCDEPSFCDRIPCERICDPCPTVLPSIFLTGPYAGALIGYNHMWTHTKGKLFDFFRAHSQKKHSNSVIGELELGWRYIFPLGLTAGIEFAADFSHDHIKSGLTFFPSPLPSTAFTYKLRRNVSLVSSLTIGKIFCCRWHAFVKLGIGVSWFKSRLTPTPIDTFNSTKYKGGFVPAVGLEYGYDECFSILGTVGYEIYERVSSRFKNPIVGFASQATTRVTPKFFNVKVGLLYRL